MQIKVGYLSLYGIVHKTANLHIMIKPINIVLCVFSSIRLIPHILILLSFHNKNSLLRADIDRWIKLYRLNIGPIYGFIYLMTKFPEFRNIFYRRIGRMKSAFISFLCPQMSTLYIGSGTISEGFFIQHGFSTIIYAKSIGKNCWINQQVTIGFSNKVDCPTIGNDVTINAGAIIIGNVHIGDGSIIGAGAVIVKDVPENSTVVGAASRIIRKNGERVNELL